MKGIFLDSETNGLNPYRHCLIEIAYKIIDLKSGAEEASFQAVVYQTQSAWKASDPASLAINGFTYDEVQAGIPIAEVSLSVQKDFNAHSIKRGEAVFVCQNPSFDRSFFAQLIDPSLQERLHLPYHWLDLASMYWAESMRSGRKEQKKLPWNTGFSKDKIAAVYGIPPESTPHRAMQGVEHLIACYSAVVGFSC